MSEQGQKVAFRREICPTKSKYPTLTDKGELFPFSSVYLSYESQNFFLKTIAHLNDKKKTKKHFLSKKKFFWSIFPQFQLLIDINFFVFNVDTVDFLYFAPIFRKC